MKQAIVFGVLLGLVSPAFSQTNDIPAYRLPIYHADPWFVKSMLEGAPVTFPEMSTLMNVGAFAQQAMQSAGTALFSSGRWVVNPTDNSLWFFPNKK